MIYMPPPAGMREYWRREDDQNDLHELAKRVVGDYIIHGTADERATAMQNAARWSGFEVEIAELNEDTREISWRYRDPDFQKFQAEVRGIERYKFEYEVNQVATVMSKWRRRNYAKLSAIRKLILWLKS